MSSAYFDGGEGRKVEKSHQSPVASRQQSRNLATSAGPWRLATGDYSYLNASIGSMREARRAGHRPLNSPTMIKIAVDTARTSRVISR